MFESGVIGSTEEECFLKALEGLFTSSSGIVKFSYYAYNALNFH